MLRPTALTVIFLRLLTQSSMFLGNQIVSRPASSIARADVQDSSVSTFYFNEAAIVIKGTSVTVGARACIMFGNWRCASPATWTNSHIECARFGIVCISCMLWVGDDDHVIVRVAYVARMAILCSRKTRSNLL